MKLNEIKQALNGYFIYKNKQDYELGFKEGKDFKLIKNNVNYLSFKERFTLTPIRYLLVQVNNNLLDPLTYVDDLADVIPVIDFDVFTQYDDRDNEIKQHTDLLTEIQQSKSIFGRKKDFKLIYVKTHNYLDDNKEQIGYYVIKDSKVVPVDADLLDDTAEAVEVKHLQSLKNALKDSLVNEYTEKYEQECRKWDSLN